MLLKCIFVWEIKSLTNNGEPWEIKSWTAVGDEDYAPLQTLFWNVSDGDSYYVV